MANQFAKEERVAFEEMMMGFEDSCVMAQNVRTYRPPDAMAERAGNTIWRPMPYIHQSFTGTDMTSNFQDANQLTVPTSIDSQQSVPWHMSASELRDMLQEGRLYEAAKEKLSSDVNVAIQNVVSNQATIVVKRTAAASGFSDVAAADAVMRERGIPSANRYFAYSPGDYNDAANNLAGKTLQTPPNSKSLRAYEEAYVGRVAGFETFKLDYANQLAAATATSVTVNGANQFYVPTPTAVSANGGRINVDNRTQTLAVSATGTLQAGDCFTIANVFAVNRLTKQSTGQLMTFRVIVGGGGGDITISPPIISGGGGSDAELQYQNVDSTPANGAVITFLNTAAASINPFWAKDSIELVAGRYVVPSDAGVSVLRARTKSGIEVTLTKGFDIDTLQTKYRADCHFGATCLNPEMCGLALFSQT